MFQLRFQPRARASREELGADFASWSGFLSPIRQVEFFEILKTLRRIVEKFFVKEDARKSSADSWMQTESFSLEYRYWMEVDALGVDLLNHEKKKR